MELVQLLVLAIVQGVAEFLPISSSGHVVLSAAMLERIGAPLQQDLLRVNIALHLGTLLAIVVYYWQRLWRMLGADRRVLGLVIVGTVPAVIIGLPLKRYAEGVLESPLVAACMLLANGVMLLWARRLPPASNEYTELSFRQALSIGVLQAVALLPGISRSGTTIIGGLGVGLRKDSAAAFAFLLAVPAIGGAGLLEALTAVSTVVPQSDWWQLGVAMTAAFGVGMASLWWLLRWLEQGRLYQFAYWCFAVGGAGLVWQLAEWARGG